MRSTVGVATTFCVLCSIRAVGKAPSPSHPYFRSSLPGTQGRLHRPSEGLTLGEPTETPTLSFSFWISLNKHE